MVPISSFNLVLAAIAALTASAGAISTFKHLWPESRGPRLGFVQFAFPYDAFVRFVDTLDPVLILADTLRQFFGDFINTAVGEAAHWGQELYSLADVKFIGMHGVSAPRRKSVYRNCGRRVSGHHGGGCRFRKLHPLDSRTSANQNMIAGCSAARAASAIFELG